MRKSKQTICYVDMRLAMKQKCCYVVWIGHIADCLFIFYKNSPWICGKMLYIQGERIML